MPNTLSYLPATIEDDSVIFEEADLNWRTRELLDSICASVANVAEDFTADAAMVADLGF